ncbi:MAG TPA: membrane dipeptidase [Solirubrobacterales bacterium]|nr:membrane dipeptidase [Solirubrobacterales bacterium]
MLESAPGGGAPDAPETFPGLSDMHAHPAVNSFLWGRDLRKHYWTGGRFDPLASLTDFKMLRRGGVKVLWSSVYVPEKPYLAVPPIHLLALILPSGRKLLKHSSWECLLMMMDNMERQVGRVDDFEIVRSNQELDAARAADKTAIVHTVEGGHTLDNGLADDDVDGRLERLGVLAERGVASITIAHHYPNQLAGHAIGIPKEQLKLLFWRLPIEVDPERGLTPIGAAVIERMIELRIVPDVAHCTTKARRDIYELVADRIPIVATHVGVQSMNSAPYNLDRIDAEAIASSGGVAGVIFMPYWLEETDPGDGREAIWRTMETLHDWTGSWRHVGLGTDFDGFTNPADDWDSSAKLPAVREMLGEKGLAEDDTKALLGGNARRVLRDGWRWD